MVSKRILKQSIVRLEWIKEEAEELKSGPLTAEVVETGLKTSSKESLKAAIPFVKGRMSPEAVLYVDIPVEDRYTDVLSVAQPLSKKGRLDLPVQLSCVTDGTLPSTLLWTREGFLAAEGEEDPFFKILSEDTAFWEMLDESFLHKYPASLDGRTTIKTKWGVYAEQLFRGKVLCVLNTGTDTKGVFRIKRDYDLKLRFLLLKRVMKDVQKLDYTGETALLKAPPVYEILRRRLKMSKSGAQEFQELVVEPSVA